LCVDVVFCRCGQLGKEAAIAKRLPSPHTIHTAIPPLHAFGVDDDILLSIMFYVGTTSSE